MASDIQIDGTQVHQAYAISLERTLSSLPTVRCSNVTVPFSDGYGGVASYSSPDGTLLVDLSSNLTALGKIHNRCLLVQW